ncbi:MAG: tRNA 2-selenouridine(34) synthase MnmH [Xenococcaceae cyanobacterium]
MVRSPTNTKSPWQETYSEIIDVRSEGEFAEDHIPGAINLPVLNDEERAKVGTIYKQVSPFEARKIGASLVTKNISNHLSHHFAAKEKNYSPLVYCWRGGQRSNSLALVLTQIGWHVTVLEGGYKTYRAYVREQLEKLPLQFTYKVLCGLTGTGKTHILRKLAQRKVQVLDLEGLANHRGSLLGEEWKEKPKPQPSQKKFESLLLQELQNFDASKTVWVESESNKIGQVYLPPALWEMMKQASCVEVQLPLEARVEWLLQEYPHLVNYPDVLKSKLQQLKSHYGWEKIQQWYRLIDGSQWLALVGDLLKSHYDPAYRRSMSKTYQRVKKKLPIPDLSVKSVNAALDVLFDFSPPKCNEMQSIMNKKIKISTHSD